MPYWFWSVIFWGKSNIWNNTIIYSSDFYTFLNFAMWIVRSKTVKYIKLVKKVGFKRRSICIQQAYPFIFYEKADLSYSKKQTEREIVNSFPIHLSCCKRIHHKIEATLSEVKSRQVRSTLTLIHLSIIVSHLLSSSSSFSSFSSSSSSLPWTRLYHRLCIAGSCSLARFRSLPKNVISSVQCNMMRHNVM